MAKKQKKQARKSGKDFSLTIRMKSELHDWLIATAEKYPNMGVSTFARLVIEKSRDGKVINPNPNFDL